MVKKESEKIYSLGYSLTIFSSFLAMFLEIGSYMMFSTSKNDTIFASIAGMILSFIIFLIVKFIINKNDQNDIYELNQSIFGKIFGNILNVVMWIGFFILALVIVYNIADFFNTEYLLETSVDYLKLLALLPIVYISTKNISTVIKTNQILSAITIGIIIIDFIGIYPSFEFSNLEPIFNTSKLNFIKSTLIYTGLSIVPLSMLLVTSKKNIIDTKNLNKNLNRTFFITNIFQILIIISTILTLGMEYIDVFRFPQYIALKQFSLFNILERVENVLALQFFFNSFALLSFLYYFLIKLIPKTKIKRSYSIVIAIAQVIITKIIFKNTVVFRELVHGYLLYVILICIFFPILLTYIKMLINNRNKNNG